MNRLEAFVFGGLSMIQKIIFNILQVLVVMLLSPLVKGVIDCLKENIQSKNGPSIFQPYRDI